METFVVTVALVVVDDEIVHARRAGQIRSARHNRISYDHSSENNGQN